MGTKTSASAIATPSPFFSVLTLHVSPPGTLWVPSQISHPTRHPLGMSKKQTIVIRRLEKGAWGGAPYWTPGAYTFQKPFRINQSPIHAHNHGATDFSTVFNFRFVNRQSREIANHYRFCCKGRRVNACVAAVTFLCVDSRKDI